MAHIPHLYIAGIWDGSSLYLSPEQAHHLDKVLRTGAGSRVVTYTDGRGRVGRGEYRGGEVTRGEESTVGRPSALSFAVAPPTSRDRCRFLVEKLAELGVARLQWLATRYGEGKVPSIERMSTWAIGALEQSRGAWLTEVGAGFVAWEDLDRPLAIAAPGGDDQPIEVVTIAIGPEGGWDPAELPSDAGWVDLGPTILRVETAAIVAAARFGRPWHGT